MTTSASRAIPAEIPRTWLLVSAQQEASDFELAYASDADQIILDLEDAVDASLKAAAREAVVDWLLNGRRAWVRINDRSSENWTADVDALVGSPGLAGVVLAKTESGAAVTETFDRLGGRVPIVPLLESAVGIEESVAIARARGALRLAFGSGDYRRDTGASADDLAMAYPRSRLVVASRVGGLPGPIDGPTVSESHPTIREQSGVAVALGMTGRLCLFRGQIGVVNECMSPAPADVAWAREFLADFEARGRRVRDGSDLPRLGRAERIDRIAQAFSDA
jgi:citrate lyase subunit beta/citryl-CoA lyase